MVRNWSIIRSRGVWERETLVGTFIRKYDFKVIWKGGRITSKLVICKLPKWTMENICVYIVIQFQAWNIKTQKESTWERTNLIANKYYSVLNFISWLLKLTFKIEYLIKHSAPWVSKNGMTSVEIMLL